MFSHCLGVVTAVSDVNLFSQPIEYRLVAWGGLLSVLHCDVEDSCKMRGKLDSTII